MLLLFLLSFVVLLFDWPNFVQTQSDNNLLKGLVPPHRNLCSLSTFKDIFLSLSSNFLFLNSRNSLSLSVFFYSLFNLLVVKNSIYTWKLQHMIFKIKSASTFSHTEAKWIVRPYGNLWNLIPFYANELFFFLIN